VLPVSSTHCTKIVVPAQSVAANIAGALPHFSDRIEQIHFGAFVAETAMCFSEPTQIPTLMTTHRFHHIDEYENLLGVVRHLLIDGYEFMMVVVGIGRGDRHLWKLLAALGLLHIVTLVPRGMPWDALLASGDIFIRPRPRDHFDPQLLEAMSMGAAVAACRGGVDDLIIENRTALLFDPNDELSILRTLRQLLDRREQARRIAENSLKYLRENHSVDRMISATIQMYQGIHA
jgi:glycosyltransferase involved in cell wall biosynthesis